MQDQSKILSEGWVVVSFASDCEGEDDETCSVCGGFYTDCPCAGPTQDGYEYLEIDGMLYAKKTTEI